MSEIVSGTLNDIEIKKMAESKQLIISNYNENNVQQACYEVRAGNEFFVLNGTESVKKQTGNDGEIVFKPHQTIVVISMEEFSIPDNILARFLTKGSLFSVGFVPVNTYADPGFQGVMTNASNNYLKIKSGDGIAKVEFSKLQNPVEHPYHGQHGYGTGIWPLKSELIIPQNEVKRKIPDYDEYTELVSAFGPIAANKLKKLYYYGRRFLIISIIIIIVNLGLIGVISNTTALDPIMSVLFGILGNVIFLILEFLIRKVK